MTDSNSYAWARLVPRREVVGKFVGISPSAIGQLSRAITLFGMVLLAAVPSVALATCYGQVSDEGWHAQAIRVRGKMSLKFEEDDATRRTPIDWSARREGDGGFAEGVDAVRTAKGVTTFTTTNNTLFGWGINSDKEVVPRDLAIGRGWVTDRNPWVVQLRIQQSKKTSKWFVGTRRLAYGRSVEASKSFEVKGRSEQTVTVPMGWIDKPLIGVFVGTTDPGNKVSVRWVKVGRPSAVRYFRKSLVLPQAPVAGKLVLGTNGRFRLRINGRLIAERGGGDPFQRRQHVIDNLAKYFRRGENTISVESEAIGTFSSVSNPKDYFFLQGLVFVASGEAVAINTDSTWSGSYSDEAGWDQPGFNDSRWKKVVSIGGVKRLNLDGSSDNGSGAFIEPSYMGRIMVAPLDHEYPFFSVREGAKFLLNVIAPAATGESKLVYSVATTAGEEIKQGQLVLGDSPDPWLQAAQLVIPQLNSGPKHLCLNYFYRGKLVERRSYEFVMAGEISQRVVDGNSFDDGIKRILRDVIDPVKDIQEGRYMSNGEAGNLWSSFRMRTTGGNSYVETGPRKGDWLSFKYRIKNLYRPHVVELSYPADTNRNMSVVVAEKNPFLHLRNLQPNGAVTRSVGGVYTSDGNRGNAGQGVFHLLFWPTQHEGTLTVITGARTKLLRRGALSSAKIYEIEDELPALKPSAGLSNRFFGPYSERIDRTLPRVFYAGELGAKFPYLLVDGYFDGYYTAWYQTISNLIRYLRFTGQNTYFAGIYMYNGAWFPSSRFQGSPTDGADDSGLGWPGGAVALMARMFEANDLNLVLGVEFFGSRKILQLDDASDAEVQQGRESVRLINNNGEQVHGYGVYNFLLPEVRDEMVALAKEITDRYRQYPGVKGITWLQAPVFPPEMGRGSWADRPSGLEVGYGDKTIDLFRRETAVPVPKFEGPRRFAQRYEWLLQNAKKSWISWRSNKVYELDETLASVFRSARPDWKVWKLTRTLPDRSVKAWSEKRLDFTSIFEYRGIDPDHYAKGASPKLMPVLEWTGEQFFGDTLGDMDAAQLTEKFNQAPELGRVLTGGGVFLRMTFMLERTLSTNRLWPWQSLKVVSSPGPAGRGFVALARPIFQEFDPQAVMTGWSDSGHIMGHEQGIRDIGRLFEVQRINREPSPAVN